MLWPPPYIALLVVFAAIAVVWWLSHRIEVAHEPVALMVTRIAFPPNMRLHDPDNALAMIELRDEIVIPYSHATLVIDFPLTRPAHVAISSTLQHGFTRGELVRLICEEYMHVYAAEAGTAPEEPEIEHRGERRERTRTDGAYGIWGHALEDLVLTSARWVKQSNGDVRIDLFVAAKSSTTPQPAPQLPG